MGKASRKKKKVAKTPEFCTSKLERRQTGLPSKAAPLSVIIIAALVAVVTFIVFLPALGNKFVNWDDNFYVYDNPNIRLFNTGFLKWALFDFYSSNWHPLTWFSHAIDYSIWGLNPLGHHLTNVILHALNTTLVVFVSIQLLALYSNKTKAQTASPWLKERGILITGGVTGLLFGLHPIHVESAAWVAERKDLLCALFFLLSILAYTKYVNVIDKEPVQKTFKLHFLNKHYLFALGFFVLALLSKPMAVSLPVVLMILDWYPFRRIHTVKTFWSILIEKIPFFSLSLISSVLTILAQKAGGAMQLIEIVPLSIRVLVAVKSLTDYLLKMIVPINLIPYYPYPKEVSFLSLVYPLTIVVTVGITAVCLVLAKRQRLWLLLWAYYVVTLFPVLGIVRVGSQSMADRYTYLPSLGPFLLIGLVTAWSWCRISRKDNLAIVKLFVVGAFVFLATVMMYLTFTQIGIWKDNITLWNYVIEKEPDSVYIAYNNRGITLAQMGQIDKAIKDYNKAIALSPGISEIFVNRGLAYANLGQVQFAIADFNRACELGNSFGCTAPKYLK